MIKVNSLDHKGRGISKLNDKIIFIENALPGEIVNVKINKEKSKYIEATVDKYIKCSSDRVEPLCPYFNICGGCNIMHLSYNNQLLFKQEKLKNIFNKYFNDKVKINDIVKCDNELFYRNKTTFHVKENLGFYKKGSYDIVPIDNCIISDNIINDSIKYLKKLDLRYINKIICRTNSKNLMIIIETDNKNLDIECIKEISDSIYLKYLDNYILVYGNPHIVETIGNYKYAISPDSFFQVNINTAFKLYSKIKNYVGECKTILDLYCGTGSIGIFLNENNKVTGIEINEFAIRDAIENKKLNKIDKINFICGDSAASLFNLNLNPDVIIVDPPRGGLNNDTIDNILKFKSEKIIYVSCDPLTLVRDLNLLSKEYKIIEVTPFDMFPNTDHVECVSLLSLKSIEK